MSTVSRDLPQRPHLDVPKREARELLEEWRTSQPEALDRIRGRHPEFQTLEDPAIARAEFQLADAQLVIAREYGFASWRELKHRIEANILAHQLDQAIRADARDEVVRILQANPPLLDLPVRNGNWGPPMSHAANLGRLEIIKAVAQLGARDFQHALDRALLQGQIECAHWLLQHGARLVPGLVMGACETLNPDGLQFLAESKAPFSDATATGWRRWRWPSKPMRAIRPENTRCSRSSSGRDTISPTRRSWPSTLGGWIG